jgi:hypothetical protein
MLNSKMRYRSRCSGIFVVSYICGIVPSVAFVPLMASVPLPKTHKSVPCVSLCDFIFFVCAMATEIYVCGPMSSLKLSS